MPGTAPTRNADRGLPRQRPSFAAASQPDSAPVLFRLPIASLRRELPDDSGAGSQSPITASPPVDGRAARAPTPVAEDAIQSDPIPAVQSTAPVVRPLEIKPSVTPVSPAAGTTPGVVGVDSRRSWWEHWSSGIVLILLVIALVTASIIALNDAGSTQVDQLAGAESATATSDWDLSNIAIPDLSSTAATSPVVEPNTSDRALASATPDPTPDAVTATAGTVPAPAASAAPTVAALEPAAPANPSAGTSVSAQPALSESSLGTAAPAAAPASEGLILEELELTAAQPTAPGRAALSAPTVVPPPPLASLQEPVGVAPGRLFPDLPTDRSAASSPTLVSRATDPSISLPPASVGLQGLGSDPAAGPQRTPTANAVGRAVVPGDSPALYDGAATRPAPESTAGSQASLLGGPGPVETRHPPLSAMLSGSSGGQATISTAALAGNRTGSDSVDSLGPATGSPATGIVTTAHPEMDAEAHIQAYLRFQAMNEAQNALPANRYPRPSGPSNE